MNENIEKPMIVARQEFINKLAYDINNCGLPIFVIEPILRDMHLEVKAILEKQYDFELSQYKDSLEKLKVNE